MIRTTKASEYQRGIEAGRDQAVRYLQNASETDQRDRDRAHTELLKEAANLAQANAKLTYSLALILTNKKPFGGS